MGPRKRWALAFAVALGALYWPLTRGLEPLLREAWLRSVTRALVTDARGLLPPPGQLWLGASRPELPQSVYGLRELETKLARPLAIAAFYQAWGDGPQHAFPSDVLHGLRDAGYLPLLTWEPWLSAFERHGGTNPLGSLRRIARGELDAYIRAWARGAVRYGHPLLLRPGHEPTNPWYGWAPEHDNTAEDYRAFWARLHDIFRAEGARNVLFVWTPFGANDHAWFPGADRVDWIGFDIFNYGGLAEAGTWEAFYTITKRYYDAYGALGPQLLVAETATSSSGGNKRDWVRDLFHSLTRGDFPKLRAVVLFDHPRAAAPGGQAIDWSLAEVADTHDATRDDPAELSSFTRERQRAR